MGDRLKNGIALSILPQIIAVKWFGSYPALVEVYYSQSFYPIWSAFFRTLFGWVPWSVGDIIYGLLFILLIIYLMRKADTLIKDWKILLRNTVMVLSIAYFTFHISWGLNYYRETVSKSLSLDEKYSTEDAC